MLNSIMDNAGDFITFLTKLQFYKKSFLLTFLMVLLHTVLIFSMFLKINNLFQ